MVWSTPNCSKMDLQGEEVVKEEVVKEEVVVSSSIGVLAHALSFNYLV